MRLAIATIMSGFITLFLSSFKASSAEITMPQTSDVTFSYTTSSDSPSELQSTVVKYLTTQISDLMQHKGIWNLEKACSEDEQDSDGNAIGCPEGANKWSENKKKPYSVVPKSVWILEFKGDDQIKQLAEGNYKLNFNISNAVDKRGQVHEIKIYGQIGVKVTKSNENTFKVKIERPKIYNANYGSF